MTLSSFSCIISGMKSQDMDGQLNLFGGEPYRPKPADSAEERRVELDTEAEEFLSVGRRKKKVLAEAEPEKPEAKPETTKNAKPEAKPEPKAEPSEPPKKAPVKRASGSRNIVMQRSFRDATGKTATVAFLDYNLVYTEGTDGKATLIHYPESKLAVDRYLMQIEAFGKTAGLKKTDEDPTPRNVTVKEYTE